jgi:PAS domain S-box-containing protein
MNFIPWKRTKTGAGAPPERKARTANPEPDGEPAASSDPLGSLSAILSLDMDNAAPEPVRPVAPAPSPPLSDEEFQARSQRQQDRSLYKSILKSLYDAILIVDPNGSIIASNGRAEQFFEFNEGEFWNMPCARLITGFNAKVFAKIRNHISGGRFTVLNANCMRKNGEPFPAEIAIGKIRYLNEGDLLLSVRNLERRKKGDERRELELCAARHTCVGLMVCRHDGLIEYVNPTVSRMLQCESEKSVVQRMLGDFCESDATVREMLRTPSAAAAWTGRIALRSAEDRAVEFAATASLCPARKDGLRRVVLSLTPAPKSV